MVEGELPISCRYPLESDRWNH